jgi:hypothetical protein
VQKPPEAFIVTVINEPPKETTVGDVVVGSLGMAGALLLLSLVLGAVAGGILVLWFKWRPRNWRPMPPVSPSLIGADGPPSLISADGPPSFTNADGPPSSQPR